MPPTPPLPARPPPTPPPPHPTHTRSQVSAGAMLPITSVQFGMNRVLEQAYKQTMHTEHLGSGGMMAVAMGAGACSAVLGCPAE